MLVDLKNGRFQNNTWEKKNSETILLKSKSHWHDMFAPESKMIHKVNVQKKLLSTNSKWKKHWQLASEDVFSGSFISKLVFIYLPSHCAKNHANNFLSFF